MKHLIVDARAALPQVDGLAPEARFQLEQENVRKCLAFARAKLAV